MVFFKRPRQSRITITQRDGSPVAELSERAVRAAATQVVRSGWLGQSERVDSDQSLPEGRGTLQQLRREVSGIEALIAQDLPGRDSVECHELAARIHAGLMGISEPSEQQLATYGVEHPVTDLSVIRTQQ